MAVTPKMHTHTHTHTHTQNRPDDSKNTPACSTKFPDLVLTKITITFLNLTSNIEQTIESLV